MTLLEVVLAMGVFTIVAAGILGAVLQMRRISEQDVYENTALTLARGYVEQLRGLAFTELRAAAANPAAPLALLGAAGGGEQVQDETGGSLNAGEWSRERVFLDRNAAGEDTQPMTFRFRVVLADLLATGADGIEIRLDYVFVTPDSRAREIVRSLRTVRSSVPSY